MAAPTQQADAVAARILDGRKIAEGVVLDREAARERIYGMPSAEWKARHQREATPAQQAAFAAAQKPHA